MSGYCLTLRKRLPAYLQAEPLTPERLLPLSLDEVSGVTLHVGRNATALGQWFEVTSLEEDALILQGDLSLAQGVGAGMTQGKLVVRGCVGDWAGRQMQGGALYIEGSAGDFLCQQMQGGLAQAAEDVGCRCAQGMRRGLLVLRKNAGEGLCCSMAGGTVLLLGKAGAHTAENMRRGTLLMTRREAPDGFAFTGCYQSALPVIPLLFQQLKHNGIDMPADWLCCSWRRFRGDRASLNKGEVLLPAVEETCTSEF